MDTASNNQFVAIWLFAYMTFLAVYIYAYKVIWKDQNQTGINLQITGFVLAAFGFLIGYSFGYIFIGTKLAGIGVFIGGYGIFKRLFRKNKKL